MSLMAVALLVGQALDALTFAWFMAIVPPAIHVAERNPIVLLLLAIGGVGLVILVKMGIAAFIAWRWAVRGWRPSTRLGKPIVAVLLPIAVVSGYVGFAFNSWAIIQVQALLP